MLTLEIRLLTARYAAASMADRTVPEWPPHPARVYSALVAALHENPEPPEDEVEALTWLAAAGAPDIIASDAAIRRLGQVYVPTNDQKALADIDPYIDKLTSAAQELAAAAGDEKAVARAGGRVDRAWAALLRRSEATAAADGTGTPKNAAELLNRRLVPQPRNFPAALPHDPLIHMEWSDTPESGMLEALDRVAERVVRLGHSSSLVSMRFATEPADVAGRIRWVPDETGEQIFRVPLPDQLRRLREAHERHRQVEQRILPADPVRYADAATVIEGSQIPSGPFSYRPEEWILFEVVPPAEGGQRLLLDVSLANRITRAMRGTLLRHMDPQSSPASITGHDADGAAAASPHIAYAALANVGQAHSTGTVLGVAIIPPADFDDAARRLLLAAIHDAERDAARESDVRGLNQDEPSPLRLTLGRSGVLHVKRLRSPSTRSTLTPQRWAGRARRWYSATAVALGRNPGNLNSRDPEAVSRAIQAAKQVVIADCVNMGLPEPAAVWIHRRSLLTGAPQASRFAPFPEQGSGPRRVCVHVEILFDQWIQGPLLIGAGRYFGVGLCAPVREAR